MKYSNLNIGLIDADLLDNGTRHPNLALLKIAGYHTSKGDNIQLIKSYDENLSIYDKLYISKVFNFTVIPDKIQKMIDNKSIEYGGTGFFEDGGESLTSEIEHHMPYYDLYKPYIDIQIASGHARSIYSDYLDYSIGFTTRGCFRKCDFCVNKKYNHAFLHSPIDEFLDKNRPYIYLWDDNILSYKNWEDIFKQLNTTGKPFQFRQGLDIRLIDDRKAYIIINSHCRNDIIFAFDHLKDKDIISDKLQIWKRHTQKICKLYILCAFESQDEYDIISTFERIKILMQYGSLPYIMRYENYKNSKYKILYTQIARWCNQPNFFKKMSFRQFCYTNQKYKSNQDTNCSALQCMFDFENEFPEIASKYFDLNFDDENIYKITYGYGRRYAHKPLCKLCKNNDLSWEKLCANINKKDIIQKYFTKNIDLQCLEYSNAECTNYRKKAIELIFDSINSFSYYEIIDILKSTDNIEQININNTNPILAQKELINTLIKIFSNSEITSLSIDEILSLSPIQTSKEKMLESCKLACLLDLIVMSQESRIIKIKLSLIGSKFIKTTQKEKKIFLKKLYLRLPIIQLYYKNGDLLNISNNSLDINKNINMNKLNHLIKTIHI